VPYFHVVYTLPAEIGDIAYQNKAVIYDLLFKASAETTLTIAADPKHLGARIGFMSVLLTWGSTLTHHPHAHMVVPGGGLSPDGSKWIACRPRYFLAVQVLSALFRRLFLDARYKTMTLPTNEFIRRFLIHVLPKGFHRIRHYGLLANGNRPRNIAHARQLLALPARPKEPETPEAALEQPRALPRPCPCCGSRMIIIETFARGCEPKYRPTPPAAIRIDTS